MKNKSRVNEAGNYTKPKMRKSLFEAIPKRYLQYDQEWLDRNTDYATMLPMSEVAQSPLFIDNGYAYCHERPAYDEADKRREFELLTHIFSLPKLEETFLLSPGKLVMNTGH